jgi:hypothetical protein
MWGLGLIGLLLGVVGALMLAAHNSKQKSDSSEPNVLYVPIK